MGYRGDRSMEDGDGRKYNGKNRRMAYNYGKDVIHTMVLPQEEKAE